MAGRWMVAAETARVSQGGSTEATLQVGGSAFRSVPSRCKVTLRLLLMASVVVFCSVSVSVL